MNKMYEGGSKFENTITIYIHIKTHHNLKRYAYKSKPKVGGSWFSLKPLLISSVVTIIYPLSYPSLKIHYLYI